MSQEETVTIEIYTDSTLVYRETISIPGSITVSLRSGTYTVKAMYKGMVSETTITLSTDTEITIVFTETMITGDIRYKIEEQINYIIQTPAEIRFVMGVIY